MNDVKHNFCFRLGRCQWKALVNSDSWRQMEISNFSNFHRSCLRLTTFNWFVCLLQCRCTARDLERMAEIIEGKLGVQMSSPPVSGLTFVRLFYFIFRNAASELGLSEFYETAIILSDLEQKMEILACDASCASIRASELALVMLCTQMDASVSKLDAGASQIHGLVDYAIQLQKLCRVSWTSPTLLASVDWRTIFLLHRFRTAPSSTPTAPSWRSSPTTTGSRRCHTSNVWFGNCRRAHFAAFVRPISWKSRRICRPSRKTTTTFDSGPEASALKMVRKKIGRQARSSLFASSAKTSRAWEGSTTTVSILFNHLNNYHNWPWECRRAGKWNININTRKNLTFNFESFL